MNNGLPLWPKVMEKAYVWFRGYDSNGHPGNSFAGIEWGDSGTPYRQTGHDAQVVYTGSQNAAQWAQAVQGYLATGQTVMVQTSPSAPTMVQSHVYVILSVYSAGGVWYVNDWNPWGFTETRTVSDILANDINQLVLGA